VKRSPQLDLLRGIAVLAVIVHHYYPEAVRDSHFLSKIGWAGVDLFFVLSGFLISGLLFSDWKRNGRLSIGRFFVRRGFKIYPAFYVFLLLTLPLLVVQHPAHLFHGLASECLFVQDYREHLWPHTWSLGVEEQFYFCLPFILLLLTKLRPSRAERGFSLIPAISIALVMICSWFRAHNGNAGFDGLHLRADALFLGVALGYGFHFRRASFERLARWWLLPLALALLAPLACYGLQRRTLPLVLTLNAVGFALLLWWIFPRAGVRLPPVERIGFYSYSIYLWHLPVVHVFRAFAPSVPMLCAAIVASCAAGILMGKLVEWPVLVLRDRLFPDKSHGPVDSSLPLASPAPSADYSPATS